MELIETAIFTQQATAAWSAEEYRAFQLYLVLNPEAGSVIPAPEDCERSGGGCQAGANVVAPG
jgi:hypothetical protein